jgi:hypothetical protein
MKSVSLCSFEDQHRQDIWGSHGGEYVGCYLVGCDSVFEICRWLTTLPTNLSSQAEDFTALQPTIPQSMSVKQACLFHHLAGL